VVGWRSAFPFGREYRAVKKREVGKLTAQEAPHRHSKCQWRRSSSQENMRRSRSSQLAQLLSAAWLLSLWCGVSGTAQATAQEPKTGQGQAGAGSLTRWFCRGPLPLGPGSHPSMLVNFTRSAPWAFHAWYYPVALPGLHPDKELVLLDTRYRGDRHWDEVRAEGWLMEPRLAMNLRPQEYHPRSDVRNSRFSTNPGSLKLEIFMMRGAREVRATVETNAALPALAWSHVAITYAADANVRLFLNGTRVATLALIANEINHGKPSASAGRLVDAAPVPAQALFPPLLSREEALAPTELILGIPGTGANVYGVGYRNGGQSFVGITQHAGVTVENPSFKDAWPLLESESFIRSVMRQHVPLEIPAAVLDAFGLQHRAAASLKQLLRQQPLAGSIEALDPLHKKEAVFYKAITDRGTEFRCLVEEALFVEEALLLLKKVRTSLKLLESDAAREKRAPDDTHLALSFGDVNVSYAELYDELVFVRLRRQEREERDANPEEPPEPAEQADAEKPRPASSPSIEPTSPHVVWASTTKREGRIDGPRIPDVADVLRAAEYVNRVIHQAFQLRPPRSSVVAEMQSLPRYPKATTRRQVSVKHGASSGFEEVPRKLLNGYSEGALLRMLAEKEYRPLQPHHGTVLCWLAKRGGVATEYDEESVDMCSARETLGWHWLGGQSRRSEVMLQGGISLGRTLLEASKFFALSPLSRQVAFEDDLAGDSGDVAMGIKALMRDWPWGASIPIHPVGSWTFEGPRWQRPNLRAQGLREALLREASLHESSSRKAPPAGTEAPEGSNGSSNSNSSSSSSSSAPFSMPAKVFPSMRSSS